MAAVEPIAYTDAKIRRILSTVRTIAMVGASTNWNRPSYFVMKYLQGKGYRVIPVNPTAAEQDLQGERVYASLRDIPDRIDMSTSSAHPKRRRRSSRTPSPSAPRWCGCNSASATTKPHARRGRGHRSDHEPLPEDRIRPARRRTVMERRELRHHPQPHQANVYCRIAQHLLG